MQSSTWSQYKHHNIVKFLVACTPNGAICYISPVYVGSISDVELTRVCGFVDVLKDKPGVSIMADKGFTVRALLNEINVGLNIPVFLNDKQFSAEDVGKGRKIASVRIHVERAIRENKNFSHSPRNNPYLNGTPNKSDNLCLCILDKFFAGIGTTTGFYLH